MVLCLQLLAGGGPPVLGKVGTMRKIPALGAAALVALLGLSACSVKEDKGTPAGPKEISFLTFETPNLNAAYWDAAIKRVTDKHPDIKVNKLVSPTQDRTAYDLRRAARRRREAEGQGPHPVHHWRRPRLDRPAVRRHLGHRGVRQE